MGACGAVIVAARLKAELLPEALATGRQQMLRQTPPNLLLHMIADVSGVYGNTVGW
jgi:hypothetical protein